MCIRDSSEGRKTAKSSSAATARRKVETATVPSSANSVEEITAEDWMPSEPINTNSTGRKAETFISGRMLAGASISKSSCSHRNKCARTAIMYAELKNSYR